MPMSDRRLALIHGHTYVDAPNYIEHAQIGPLQLPASSDPAVADADAVCSFLGDGHQSDDSSLLSLAHSMLRSHGACSGDSA